MTLDVRLAPSTATRTCRSPSTSRCTSCEGAASRLPAGHVWVHCKSGFRAAIAASLLARAGRDVVLITDDWEKAEQIGLPVLRAA